MEEQLAKLLREHAAYFTAGPTDGKITCLINNHQFPARYDAIATFVNGSKFAKLRQRYDAENALDKYEPFIVVSTNFPHMLYCTLTGQLLAKSLEAVKRHMKGQRFQKNKSEPRQRQQQPPEGEVVAAAAIMGRKASTKKAQSEEEGSGGEQASEGGAESEGEGEGEEQEEKDEEQEEGKEHTDGKEEEMVDVNGSIPSEAMELAPDGTGTAAAAAAAAVKRSRKGKPLKQANANGELVAASIPSQQGHHVAAIAAANGDACQLASAAPPHKASGKAHVKGHAAQPSEQGHVAVGRGIATTKPACPPSLASSSGQDSSQGASDRMPQGGEGLGKHGKQNKQQLQRQGQTAAVLSTKSNEHGQGGLGAAGGSKASSAGGLEMGKGKKVKRKGSETTTTVAAAAAAAAAGAAQGRQQEGSDFEFSDAEADVAGSIGVAAARGGALGAGTQGSIAGAGLARVAAVEAVEAAAQLEVAAGNGTRQPKKKNTTRPSKTKKLRPE
ncbi:surfeit locus protein 2-domain-containing protein [Haematococcus lacustris]